MTSIFATSRLVRAAALLAAGATFAVAAPLSAAERETPRSDRQQTRDREICANVRAVLSRIPQRVCMTQAQWIDQQGDGPN